MRTRKSPRSATIESATIVFNPGLANIESIEMEGGMTELLTHYAFKSMLQKRSPSLTNFNGEDLNVQT
jgi:hypothetical protein